MFASSKLNPTNCKNINSVQQQRKRYHQKVLIERFHLSGPHTSFLGLVRSSFGSKSGGWVYLFPLNKLIPICNQLLFIFLICDMQYSSKLSLAFTYFDGHALCRNKLHVSGLARSNKVLSKKNIST